MSLKWQVAFWSPAVTVPAMNFSVFQNVPQQEPCHPTRKLEFNGFGEVPTQLIDNACQQNAKPDRVKIADFRTGWWRGWLAPRYVTNQVLQRTSGKSYANRHSHTYDIQVPA